MKRNHKDQISIIYLFYCAFVSKFPYVPSSNKLHFIITYQKQNQPTGATTFSTASITVGFDEAGALAALAASSSQAK